MARRYFLVSYDIVDDKRRNKVFEMLLGYGDHAQYSVFFCELNQRELVELRGRLRVAINCSEDQVFILDLGRSALPLSESLECLGKAYEPLVRTVVV